MTSSAVPTNSASRRRPRSALMTVHRQESRLHALQRRPARGSYILGLIELRPQLAAGIVEGLVERARRRVEAAGEVLGRHVLDRQLDQDLALMVGQLACDQADQRLAYFL